MTTDDDTRQPLDGKTPVERIKIAHTILDAWRRQVYSLSTDERQALTQFIILTERARPVDDILWSEVNRLIRQHQQNMIALVHRDR